MGTNSGDKARKVLTAVVALQGLAASSPNVLTVEQIVRAWESPEYRETLTAEQLKQLPANPAGEIQFRIATDKQVDLIAGTQYAGCDTQYAGCDTQYAGCNTQYAGCDTQYAGCSTQYSTCEV